MKDDPNKNQNDIIKTSEGNFSKKSLSYLKEISENKEEAKDIMSDVQLEYLCQMAKKHKSDDEIDRTFSFLHLLKQMLKFL